MSKLVPFCIFQRKKEYEIEMNRFLSVSFVFWFLFFFSLHVTVLICIVYFLLQAFLMHVFLCSVDLQSLSEEEQQRVLSEEKIGFKRGGGAGSPASKKKNSKAKVKSKEMKL